MVYVSYSIGLLRLEFFLNVEDLPALVKTTVRANHM
jgi:hypothetical protein